VTPIKFRNRYAVGLFSVSAQNRRTGKIALRGVPCRSCMKRTLVIHLRKCLTIQCWIHLIVYINRHREEGYTAYLHLMLREWIAKALQYLTPVRDICKLDNRSVDELPGYLFQLGPEARHSAPRIRRQMIGIGLAVLRLFSLSPPLLTSSTKLISEIGGPRDDGSARNSGTTTVEN
jgi:hypothetical protein